MTLLEAILLGIIQGATEFLPISSSGHLLLVPTLLNLPEPGLLISAITHEGTLLAVIIYFWRDLWRIALAVLEGLRRRQPLATTDARLGWYIVVGSIPAAVVGLLFEETFEEFFGNPTAAALFLLVTAALLIIGEQLHSGTKSLEKMSWLDAIIIGIAQMLALFPGISRSGSTITAGLSRGLDRATAARYSFLLGVPAVAGAGLLSLLDLFQSGGLAEQLPTLLAAMIAAAVVGIACIHFLLSWLRQRSLYLFAAYCAAFSLFYLLVR